MEPEDIPGSLVTELLSAVEAPGGPALLDEVVDELHRLHYPIIAYVPALSVHVDANGVLYYTTPRDERERVL